MSNDALTIAIEGPAKCDDVFSQTSTSCESFFTARSGREREEDTSSEPLLDQCRICQLGDGRMCRPCACRGTIRSVHHDCLEEWVRVSGTDKCGVCGQVYARKVAGLKRLEDWEAPDGLVKFTVILVFLMFLIHFFTLCIRSHLDLPPSVMWMSLVAMVADIYVIGQISKRYLNEQLRFEYTDFKPKSFSARLKAIIVI